jgi:hypothetical protein
MFVSVRGAILYPKATPMNSIIMPTEKILLETIEFNTTSLIKYFS